MDSPPKSWQKDNHDSVMRITQSGVGDVPVCIMLMRGSGQPPIHLCLGLVTLMVPRDVERKGLLEACVPPVAVLVLSQLREDGIRKAV